MTEDDRVKNVKLNAGEHAEPLDDNGHYIIQHEDMYRFGGDAVALYKFARRFVRRDDNVFDLCSGCGVIGILLALDCGCGVDGAEIDGALCDMSMRSCELNGLKNMRYFNIDIRTHGDALPAAGYDAVVCNPPFFKADSKARTVAPAANSELTVTLGDVIKTSKRLLKVGGALFLVHTATRLDEALCACRDHGITPKHLVVNANGKTFMLRAVRGGKQGMIVSTEEF
ncbi:MAG: methyltransferase [Clostridiales bacterium]|nr:methyltransferase [Clostridiales bacterium]